MTPGRSYSISSLLQILRHRAPVIGAFGVLFAAAVAVYVTPLPNIYRAQAVVIVLPQLVPQSVVKTTVTQDMDAQLRMLGERVLAPAPLSQLATSLDLYPDAAPGTTEEELSARVRRAAAVEMIRPDAFRVSFMHPRASLAAAMANRLAEAFVAANLETRTGRADRTDEFLEQQLESTRARLEEQEQRLEAYRRTYSGQLPSQMSSNLQVAQQIQEQQRALAELVASDRGQKAKLEEALAALEPGTEPEPPGAGGEAPPIDPLKDYTLPTSAREARRQLASVRSTLAALELQLKPDHPDIARLRRIVGELEKRAKAEPSSNPADAAADRAERDRKVAQLRADLATVDARLEERLRETDELREQGRRYRQRVELAPTRETELTTLTRDYDTLRDSYRQLLAKKEETQITAALERREVGETFRLAERASIPDQPFSPNRRAIVLQAALLGIGVGLLVTAWREMRDDTFRTEAEVLATLELPVLAFIPVIPGSLTQSWRVRVIVGSAGAAAAIALLAYLLWRRP